MTHLGHEFDSDGSRLVLKADFEQGWRQAEETYCFSQSTDVEWKGGIIRVQLQVFPRPGGLTKPWELPPTVEMKDHRQPFLFKTSEGWAKGQGCADIEIGGGRATISVLLVDQERHKHPDLSLKSNRSGDMMFQWLLDVPVSERVFDHCQVQVRLTFRPHRKGPPVDRDWWNEFLPGGLPELGKSR